MNKKKDIGLDHKSVEYIKKLQEELSKKHPNAGVIYGSMPKGKEINFPDMETADRFIKQMKRLGVKEKREIVKKLMDTASEKLLLHQDSVSNNHNHDKCPTCNWLEAKFYGLKDAYEVLNARKKK